MLALKLVRLIETHSDQLANGLVARVRASHRASAYQNMRSEAIKDVAVQVYRHLGDWLLNKTATEVEYYFREKALRRQEEHVPLSDVIWILMVTKENLWRYLESNASIERSFEIFGEMELVQAIDQFFDRAIYYVSLAYEQPHENRAKLAS